MSRALLAIHIALIVVTAAFSAWMATQSYHLQFDNGKAALFAARVFAEHPGAAYAFGRQALAIVALYLFLFWSIWALSQNPLAAELPKKKKVVHLLLIWFCAWWLLLYGNLTLFPRSVWAPSLEPLMTQPASLAIHCAAAGWLVWRILLTARHVWSSRRTPAQALFLAAFVAGCLALLNQHFHNAHARADVPNVVVIGLDSLRRDVALGELGEMPNLSAFRHGAFIQSNVVSPLARTFPAWATMLTGKAPYESGMRDNLVAQDNVGRYSIAWRFKENGYRTVYATDETRFSNIGSDFGFDSVVSPRPGIPDFLLGQFGDQPLINLTIQIPFSEKLLPSLTGNRAFSHAYLPSRFIRRLADDIGPASDKPTFMAVHLCSAHWPYYSAQSSSDRVPYLRAIRELDDQFGRLLGDLTRLGYINEKSMVVVLADHGEGIAELRPSPLEQHGRDNAVPLGMPAPGHGGSLLDPAQWQVFLMFKGRAAVGQLPAGRSDQLLSLQDLPYALQQLSGMHVSAPYTMDIVREALNERTARTGGRDFVKMETGFSPRDLNLTDPNGNAALRIAESSFDVLDDGRVEMKGDVYRQALRNKDYGVTDGTRLIALVDDASGIKKLVSADFSKNRADVFSADTPPNPMQLPLFDAACGDVDMRRHLERPCASIANKSSPSKFMN